MHTTTFYSGPPSVLNSPAANPIFARDCAHAGGPVRELGGPRRSFVPQAQVGPRHRREGKLSKDQIEPLILTLLRYTSAEQGRRRPIPRFFAAGAGGVTTVEICVGAAA